MFNVQIQCIDIVTYNIIFTFVIKYIAYQVNSFIETANGRNLPLMIKVQLK